MRRLEVWCQAEDDGRLDLWLAFDSFTTAHSILDSRDASSKGTFLMTTETDALRIEVPSITPPRPSRAAHQAAACMRQLVRLMNRLLN
jgi:hypothetical protein